MDINSEQMRATLIRISQFVLHEETETIREGIQEKIVETALFWGMNEDEFTPIDKIEALIEKEIHLTKFPIGLLNEIISRSATKGSLIEDKAGNYALSLVRRKELAKQVEEKKNKVDRVNGQFLLFLGREYGKKLTAEQMEEGVERLYSLLGSLTMEKSDLIARIVTQKNLENLPFELNIHKLHAILGKIEDVELRNAEFRAIRLFFKESSDDFYSFLFTLTQNLVCLQILNLDPECQALERKAFSEKSLFLDTNILIGLVCPTDWQHKPAKNLLTLSSSLGVRCFVTSRTCDEYNGLIEEANRIFKKWESPSKFLANADNEFLVSFWSENQADQSLTWASYYQRTKDVGKILRDYGIQLYVDSLEKIRNNKHFETIANQVDDCYQLLKRRSKTKLVCEHDALLLILVRDLRKRESNAMLGPNHWLITGDDSLSCVDNKINSLSDFSDKTPSSMLFSVWLEMISPFLPLSLREGDAYEAFTMLVKYQFAIVPFHIDAEKLIKIQGSWTQYDWLEAKDIVKIQNQDWTKQYLSKLDQAKTKQDKVKAEEIGRVFANKLEEELTKIKDDKIKTLVDEKKVLTEREAFLSTTVQERTKEIDERQRTIASQRDTIEQSQSTIQSKNTQLEREINIKHKLRIVATIAGLFLIAFPLLMAVFASSTMSFQTVAFFVACLIVGAILLFFGIAPENVVVSIIAKVGMPQPKEG